MHTDADNAGDIAVRAQQLLTNYFTGKTEEQRINILYRALGFLKHNPREGLDTGGSAADFAATCVVRLMTHGCTDGHRHALSRLLETIRESAFGTHPPADYYDLPPRLDAPCALPSRHEELAYLERLLAEIRDKVRKYSPLYAVGDLDAGPGCPTLADDAVDEADIALLRLEPRAQRGLPGAAKEFDDILTAFEQVQTAALLGAPGSGKSTTLRRLAADLARKARLDAQAPLPLFVALGDWRGDESLPAFIAERVPEIGWALDRLSRKGRLILLLDGLNEVPTTKRGGKAEAVGTLLRRLISKLPAWEKMSSNAPPPKVRVIVSCRLDV